MRSNRSQKQKTLKKGQSVKKGTKNISNKRGGGKDCYRSCEHVPCRGIKGVKSRYMNHCRPMYCHSDGSEFVGSKNWTKCNMANWSPKHRRKYGRFCQQSNVRACDKTLHTVAPKYQVDVMELHNKMPYIWRFLDNKTRKKMIILAKCPVSEINVTDAKKAWKKIKDRD